jgi:hypothetical protein
MCFPFARNWFGAVRGRSKKFDLKVELKARALCAGVSIALILRTYQREKLYKIAHPTQLSTGVFSEKRNACLWGPNDLSPNHGRPGRSANSFLTNYLSRR